MTMKERIKAGMLFSDNCDKDIAAMKQWEKEHK